MRKQDVVRRIAEQTGSESEVSQFILETFFEVVKTAVSEGETVYVRSFGSFGPKRRAAKVARNLAQNTAIMVEAHTIPFFKPSPEFVRQVRSVNGGISDEQETN